MKFTYDDYFRHVDILRQRGYAVVGYGDEKREKNAILRHDVDFSLKKAAEFAQRETEHGVKSTYFVLMHSDFYNPFSRQSQEYLQTILAGGHEIGLHFDEMCYDIGDCFDLLNEAVMSEKGQLEQALGQTVCSVSMHRPSRFTLEGDFSFDSLVNSYSQEFFKNWKYISDSRMNWREDAMETITCGQYRNLHILTHPFWYAEEEEDTRAKLVRFINAARTERYESLDDNFRDLPEFVDRSECI